MFGVVKSGSLRNRSALNQFLELLEIADFDRAAAAAFGPLQTVLEAAGSPIGPLDTQTTAHALAFGVILVSHNMRAFVEVPEFCLANSPATP